MIHETIQCGLYTIIDDLNILYCAACDFFTIMLEISGAPSVMLVCAVPYQALAKENLQIVTHNSLIIVKALVALNSSTSSNTFY